MIQPIGNRLLVRPLNQDAVARQLLAAMRSEGQEQWMRDMAKALEPEPGKIALVSTVPPVSGRVIAVGRPFCTSCRDGIESQVRVDDVVVFPKTAGMEIEIDGAAHLMMRPDDILLIWRHEAA